ncbi:hypothetical protein OH76DRAFT_1298982, partial [Lentinus brumalis]
EEWVDELASMSEEEQAEFEVELVAVKVVLAKIRKVAFKIINSVTILLPAWREICLDLNLNEKLIPRDVKTHWNSTFDMALVTIQYK